MKEGLSYSVSDFFGAFKGWFFVLSLVLLGAAFVFDVILSLKSEKFYKKRAWYFVVLFGLVLFESGVELFALKGEFLSEGIAFPLTLAGAGTLLYTPLFFVETGEARQKEETKPFLAESEVFKKPVKNGMQTLFAETAAPLKAKEAEIDFSHVRSVIDKLDGYPLSPADRKTVRELKYAVSAAENCENGETYREKINDGLGSILKMMSRYGV